MQKNFGTLPNGQQATLFFLTRGGVTVGVTDMGAALVELHVPDKDGNTADVVLGYDNAADYLTQDAYLGAVVGRNANRTKGAAFVLNGQPVMLAQNERQNNLHSGPDCFHKRQWAVEQVDDTSITFRLDSPHGDQGFPGNAVIRVTYSLDAEAGLHIAYDAVADRDTVFNMTNHAYFNMAGHDHPEKAMSQLLTLPGRFFNPDDAENIPTGEQRSVAGTPMDFRVPKPIGQDIGMDYEPLHLQGGYDHNWEVFCNPCAILTDPDSGRTMTVSTDCTGIQFYSGNYLNNPGKGGVHYGKRSGIALETQFAPDSLHHPDWPQPITPAGVPYHSETVYRFHW